ncbi:hypothetical protein NFJ02_35g88140 [Pycnococcus provasolii]
MRMRRRHLRESTTVPGALEVHIPITKNNQGGDMPVLEHITVPVLAAHGVNLLELKGLLDILSDLRGLGPDDPVFGDMLNPSRFMNPKNNQIMLRLHGQRTKFHEPYYEIIHRYCPGLPKELGTKHHAFRRGGLFAVRQMARASLRLGGDGLMLFLKTFGRWKSLESMLKYIVHDRDEMAAIAGGWELEATSPLTKLAAGPEPTADQRRACMLAAIAAQAVQPTQDAPALPTTTPHQLLLEPPALPTTTSPNATDPATTTTTLQALPLPPPPPPPQTSADDDTFEVTDVLCWRWVRGRKAYLVQWTGSAPDSWHFGEDLAALGDRLSEVPELDEAICDVCASLDARHPQFGAMLLCSTDGCGGARHVKCDNRTRVPSGTWWCIQCRE